MYVFKDYALKIQIQLVFRGKFVKCNCKQNVGNQVNLWNIRMKR